MRIEIKGPIISDGDQRIYDWFDIPAVSPKKVQQQIDEAIKNNEVSLNVVINSGGGSVFAASEIYYLLKSFKGDVLIDIPGIAASAASVVAMAATHLSMAPTGQMMIHNASTGAYGDYRTMSDTSEFLEKTNQSIASAYTLKTGKSYDELKPMMDKETWMTAQFAKDNGFIDEILFQNELGAVANTSDPSAVHQILPKEVIEKVRNELAQDKSQMTLNAIQQNVITDPETDSVNSNQVPEEATKMDLTKLKNDFPELYEEVINIGKQEGVQAEKHRIKEIEDLSLPGNESLVYNAKFETGKTVAEFALEIVKAEKEKGQNFLNNRQEDVKDTNEVPGDHAPLNNQNTEEQEVELLKNAWGGTN